MTYQPDQEPTEEGKRYIREVMASFARNTGASPNVYISLERACPVCHGRRWLMDASLARNDPGFGKLIRCGACDDPAKKRAHLESLSNLPPRFSAARFSDWWPTTPQRKAALDAATSALSKRERGQWLTLWGSFGSGKTQLAASIVNEAIGQGVEARFWIMASMLDHLREAYDPKKGDDAYSNVFESLVNCPVLVLDECTEYKSTDWAYEKFRQLVNERYNQFALTVFITNTDPNGAPPAGLGFLYSRMRQFPMIELSGDVRRKVGA